MQVQEDLPDLSHQVTHRTLLRSWSELQDLRKRWPSHLPPRLGVWQRDVPEMLPGTEASVGALRSFFEAELGRTRRFCRAQRHLPMLPAQNSSHQTLPERSGGIDDWVCHLQGLRPPHFAPQRQQLG